MISVIIPARNAAATIERAVRSACYQEGVSVEVVVVDDGSTDHTTAIVTSLQTQNPAIRLVRQEASGVSVARNHGVSLALGDWVSFLDADDQIPPGALAALVTAGTEIGVDVVFGGYRQYPVHPNEAAREIRLTRTTRAISGDRALIAYVHGKMPSVIWNGLYQRTILRRLRFDPSVGHEDADFLPRALAMSRRVALTPDIVYHYIRRPGSFMDTLHRRRLDSIVVQQRLLSLCRTRGESLRTRGRATSLVVHAAWGVTSFVDRKTKRVSLAERRRWYRLIYQLAPRRFFLSALIHPYASTLSRLYAICLAIDIPFAAVVHRAVHPMTERLSTIKQSMIRGVRRNGVVTLRKNVVTG